MSAQSAVPRAWLAIAGAEIRFNLRRAVTWVFLLVLVGVSLLFWSKFGSFGSEGSQNIKLAKNSDYNLIGFFAAFSFILMHFTATLMTDPVARDFRFQADPLLRSAPIRRRDYLLGKFLGNYLVLTGLYAIFALTLFILQAVQFPETVVLPWRLLPYLKHFATFVVVFNLGLGAFCFTVGTLTRSAKLVYGIVTGFYVLYFTILNLIRDPSQRWFAILDPSGLIWLLEQAAKDRGNAWLNANPIRYNLDLFLNRGILLAAAALSFAVLFARFSMVETGAESKRAAKKAGAQKKGRRWLLGDRAAPRPISATGSLPHAPELLVEGSRIAARGGKWSRRSPDDPLDPAGLDADRPPTPLPAVTIARGGLATHLRQFFASVGAELRLLRAERSLFIMIPVVMLFCGTNLESSGGPFNAPLLPVSSEYAAGSVRALLLLLVGITIFYTGEVVHRERQERVSDLLWSQPVPDWILILSKYVAMVLLSFGFMIVAALTAMAWQASKSLVPVGIRPYLVIYSVILVPTVLFMVAFSLALNYLLRNKYLAYFAGIAGGAALLLTLLKGHRNWVYNPVLQSLWTYSDMTGLAPYRTGLLLHRIYWIAITVFCLALAHWVFGRASGGAQHIIARARLVASARAIALCAVSAVVAVASGITIGHEIGRGEERKWLEQARNRYEDTYKKPYQDVPQPEWQRVDLQVDLDPPRHGLSARGTFALVNRTGKPIPKIFVNLDPTYDWRTLTIDGATAPPEKGELVRIHTLDTPLPPAGTTTLHAEWTAVIPSGIRRQSPNYSNFIEVGGSFLGSNFTDWLPAIAYQVQIENDDEDIRKKYGKKKQEPVPEMKGAAFVPAAFGTQNLAFDLHIEITVPSNETALSSGRLISTQAHGDRKTFVYEADHPVVFFPVLSAPYAERRRGDFAVYYFPGHPFNVDKLLDAMEASRKKYERDFGVFPFKDLRIAEYPRMSGFAQGHPTMIPFSESIGFLTHDDEDHVNSNYFVAAHEIGHQWFGNIVEPGRSKGENVLSEGLAEYAAGALMDETLGKKATKVFRKYEEDTYLRRRRVDYEMPLVTVDDSHPSHSAIRYQKAGMVFHMLETLIGREKMNAALKEYVTRFGWKESHPTIHDLIAILKAQTPDGSLEWFYDEWFEKITIPDFHVVTATVRQDGNEYVVEFTADNVGQGKMPVMVEAVSGKDDDDKAFKSAGVQVVVEAGKETKGTIRCPFKPEKVVLDRMFEVIDFERGNNQFKLRF